MAEIKDNRMIKEKLADFFVLPKEVILDYPKVSLIGNRQLTIENYKGIIEYSSDKIRINTEKGLIKIIGQNLEINTVTTEEIYISGYINNIEFSN